MERIKQTDKRKNSVCDFYSGLLGSLYSSPAGNQLSGGRNLDHHGTFSVPVCFFQIWMHGGSGGAVLHLLGWRNRDCLPETEQASKGMVSDYMGMLLFCIRRICSCLSVCGQEKQNERSGAKAKRDQKRCVDSEKSFYLLCLSDGCLCCLLCAGGSGGRVYSALFRYASCLLVFPYFRSSLFYDQLYSCSGTYGCV